MHNQLPSKLLRRPVWWHPNGIHMHVESVVKNHLNCHICIQGKHHSCWLKIAMTDQLSGIWQMQWNLYNHPCRRVAGSTMVTTAELCLAFAINPTLEDQDPLVGRWQQWVCRPGAFFRLKEFLNIPCRGTGQNGDPNISLFVTSDIQTHLANLIAL